MRNCAGSIALTVLTALLGLATVHAATATTATPPSVVRSVESDLDYDANGKLVNHVVLFSESCSTDMTQAFAPPRFFEAHTATGHAEAQVFAHAGGDSRTSTTCRAACLERGTDQQYAYAVMPHKYYDATTHGAFDAWFVRTCSKVEVCLMSYHSKDDPIQVYWVHPAAAGDNSDDSTPRKQTHHMDISYGERNTRCFSSFIGHEFVAQDSVTKLPVGEPLIIQHVTMIAFGDSPSLGDNTLEFDDKIEQTLQHEWNRHERIKRTFSPLGFKKGRLPDDVFASMGAFYYNNRFNKEHEEWNGRGVFVNWWEAGCSFIQIPWESKRLWQVRLRELVEDWAGVPLEQTDMYGLRQYEEGARLISHVDREATHAVSLIVNLAQGNLTEPWPVEVQDHADRLHEVVMQPGDIVYYESAKCLHARNRPLAGPDAYYVNLFTHYRPVGDEKWFEKENHKGTPEPVMEAKGSCRLERTGTTVSTSADQLAYVEAVKCDDERLGSFISPSLFTAKSGKDLIDWWRKTAGPKNRRKEGARDEL